MTNDEIKVHVVKRAGREFLQLEWDDPVTGKTHSRSAKTANMREANRRASTLEEQLRDGTFGIGYTPWAEFRQAYLDEMDGRREGTLQCATATLNYVESLINPKAPSVFNEQILSKFRQKLRQQKVKGRALSAATCNKHLRTLRAILNWGRKNGHLRRVPDFTMVDNQATAKARGVTTEEFERMLAATEKVIEGPLQTIHLWRRLLRGLWASGMRLGEALALRWHDGPVCIVTSGKRPAVRFGGEIQKNGKDQTVPITPEFWEVLNEIPEGERVGYVFDVSAERVRVGGKVFAVTCRRVDVIGRVITELGKVALVKVNHKGKFASSHDIRRAFGARWATKVVPTVLMQLMRHANIDTTMRYYAGGAVDVVSDAVWSAADASRVDTTVDTCEATPAEMCENVEENQ
jgi:integrase